MSKQQPLQKVDARFNKILNPAYLKRGIIIFIIITLVAFTGLFLYSNTGEVIQAMKEVKMKFILLACVMALFDWWIGGMRNHIFVRETNPGISQRVCFDANLANIFLGAVTPSQTGGGPAHLYMLWRGGVKLTDGVAVSVVNYISTIVFFILSSGTSIYFLKDIIDNDFLKIIINSGFVIFATAFSIVLLSLILPKKMGTIIIKIAGRIESIFNKKLKGLKDKSVKLASELENYHATMMLFFTKKPYLLPLSFIITCIMYFNKYALAYVLLLGLSIEADFWTVIAIQAVLFFILYFAPSPGGSGIAELSIAVLMAQIIVESKLASFTLLHRTFLLFLGALIGAMLMMKELKRQGDEQSSATRLQ